MPSNSSTLDKDKRSNHPQHLSGMLINFQCFNFPLSRHKQSYATDNLALHRHHLLIQFVTYPRNFQESSLISSNYKSYLCLCVCVCTQCGEIEGVSYLDIDKNLCTRVVFSFVSYVSLDTLIWEVKVTFIRKKLQVFGMGNYVLIIYKTS
jgi:hypothetical protein